MRLKSTSAALLLCCSLLSTPVFGQTSRHNGGRITTDAGDLPTSETSTVGAAATPTDTPPSTTEGVRRPALTAPAESAGTNNKANVGAIAGGVVGGLLALALIALGVFLFMRRRRKNNDSFELEKSPPASAAPRTSSPSAPASLPPPQQQPIGTHEEHALMSHYGDSQPQNIALHPGDSAPQMMPYGADEVIPVIGAPKPHALPSSREIDDDEISLDSPSPSGTPNPERQRHRSVPRLPMYQSSRDDQSTSPGL